MEVFRESGKMRNATKALVAVHIQSDTREMEMECLLVEEESDVDEQTAEQWNSHR